MFVDSSALVAMLLPEPDGPDFASHLQGRREAYTSSIAIFETALALRRLRSVPLSEIVYMVEQFLPMAGIKVVDIEADEYVGALSAFEIYGKGSGNPAQLNMGDCFAYAAAKRLGVPLLYKGNDFSQTDLA
jgi:ribonuclease VapC